jgi:RHS repeat-associated protein
VTQFSYDGAGRLSGITESKGGNLSSITLQHDGAGQVTSTDRNVPTSPDPAAGALPLAYDAADQVQGYTYDQLGRVTRDGLHTYTWDLGSRLTGYSGSDGSASFNYDALGMRIAKTSGGATENYVINYALGLPAVSIVRAGSSDVRYYVYMPGGALLYSVEAADGKRHFYHFDEAGSTLFLTDDGGSVSDSYGVTPYGETITASGSTPNPFTFLGAYGVMQEGTTGLYYMRARYYDSTTARFLSPDPVLSLDPGGVNPYQYALANPLLLSDPLGLTPGAGSPCDVPAPSPYFSFIQKMRELRITNGCPGAGSATLTRGQMAVFLIRAQLGTLAEPGQPSAGASVTGGTRLKALFNNIPAQTQIYVNGVQAPTGDGGTIVIQSFSFNGASVPSPTIGTATVNGSYAPISTASGAASSSLPVPRFADTTSATNSFQVYVAPTNLLFPFVTNQAGFDTGLAIANTSAVPFGTTPQTGACTLNFYGPTAPFVTGPLNSNAAPGFQGYTIAVCNFQYAHGFAYISDIGARNLAMGYLALVNSGR